VVEHLTLMAGVLAASALLLGAVAERLHRAGVSTEAWQPWRPASACS
jgi:hypothetical protein